jgi:hypothetical protein
MYSMQRVVNQRKSVSQFNNRIDRKIFEVRVYGLMKEIGNIDSVYRWRQASLEIYSLGLRY